LWNEDETKPNLSLFTLRFSFFTFHFSPLARSLALPLSLPSQKGALHSDTNAKQIDMTNMHAQTNKQTTRTFIPS
jgi:hypothetical protein